MARVQFLLGRQLHQEQLVGLFVHLFALHLARPSLLDLHRFVCGYER
jgi:hypothetical protein